MMCPVKSALKHLNDKKTNIKCSGKKGLIKTLEGLGFVVKDNKKAGHKSYVHPAIDDFMGSNFDCGHGKTDKGGGQQIKPAYVSNVIKVIEKYEDELKEYNAEN